MPSRYLVTCEFGIDYRASEYIQLRFIGCSSYIFQYLGGIKCLWCRNNVNILDTIANITGLLSPGRKQEIKSVITLTFTKYRNTLKFAKTNVLIYLVFETIHILERTKCLHIHLLFFDFYTIFAGCKHSLQINITILVSELNTWTKIWEFSNRGDARNRDHRLPGIADKGGYSDRTSVLCHM